MAKKIGGDEERGGVGVLDPVEEERGFSDLRAVVREVYEQVFTTSGYGDHFYQECATAIVKRCKSNRDLRDDLAMYGALQVAHEVGRSSRVAAAVSEEDETGEETLVRQMARERGRLNDGGTGRAQTMMTWMHRYVLFNGRGLYDARLSDIIEQRKRNDALAKGNAATAAFMGDLERLYSKRCPKGDKPLGEVVPPAEADKLRRKHEA